METDDIEGECLTIEHFYSEPNREEINEVWFHGGCADGLGAALCFLAYSRWVLNVEHPVIVPLKRDGPIPPSKGKNIVIFDFCYNEEQLIKIFNSAKSAAVYDHHEGMDSVMGKFSNCHFDNEHSGAYLAFKYFFPDQQVPLFIRYIEDRDTWRHSIPGTREHSAYMYFFEEMDLDRWFELYTVPNEKRFVEDEPPFYKDMAPIGETLVRSQEKTVEVLAKGAKIVTFCDMTVAIVNSPISMSELGHYLLETKFPKASETAQSEGGESTPRKGKARGCYDIDLAVIWSYNHWDNAYRINLRSREGGNANCFELAKKYGGGGHRHSAAFRVSVTDDYKPDITSIIEKFNTTGPRKKAKIS